MQYSAEHRVAFLHIHKTAGTSTIEAMRTVLGDLAPMPELPEPHHPLGELVRVLEGRGEDPLDTRVVTVICHPLAHAVSIYEFWRSDRMTEADRSLPHVAATRRLGFDEFLDEVLSEDQFAQHLLVDGIVPANVTMLRRERLSDGLSEFLADVTGRQRRLEVPVRNRTVHRSLGDYLGPDTRERLLRSYAWTFAEGLYEPDVVPAGELAAARPEPAWRRLLRRERSRP